jgi:hypothetical protein
MYCCSGSTSTPSRAVAAQSLQRAPGVNRRHDQHMPAQAFRKLPQRTTQVIDANERWAAGSDRTESGLVAADRVLESDRHVPLERCVGHHRYVELLPDD